MPDAVILQIAAEQLPQAPTAPWGESIADEVMWIGLFATVSRLGRRYLMGELLPDDMPDLDMREVTSDRDPRDRWRLWALYTLGAITTTVGIYLLTALPWAILWFGGLAFVGAAAALWEYRGGTPIDDIRLLAAARRADDGPD